LEEKFQSQIEQMSTVSVLIDQLKNQFEDLSHNSSDRIEYLEFTQKLNELKSKFADAQKESKYAIEAARWLYEKRDFFIKYSSILIFDERFRIRGEDHLSITVEGYRNFQKDLDTLFSWIINSLAADGMTPKTLRRGLLNIPVEYRFYQKVFESILDEHILNADMDEVSFDALQILIDYFNRFLIDRECQEI
jgi:membrane-anchored protein YejM (alkaline phosphatase superfamily)